MDITPEKAAEANAMLKKKVTDSRMAEQENKDSDESLEALRKKLSELPDATVELNGQFLTGEDSENYVETCRAAVEFLDRCSLVPTPDAVSQLVEAFLPCLKIICKRGYDPDGANWRAMGWRGLLMEINKRFNRIMFNGWKRGQFDGNNSIDAINYLGYYYRQYNSGSEWGDIGDPDAAMD